MRTLRIGIVVIVSMLCIFLSYIDILYIKYNENKPYFSIKTEFLGNHQPFIAADDWFGTATYDELRLWTYQGELITAIPIPHYADQLILQSNIIAVLYSGIVTYGSAVNFYDINTGNLINKINIIDAIIFIDYLKQDLMLVSKDNMLYSIQHHKEKSPALHFEYGKFVGYSPDQTYFVTHPAPNYYTTSPSSVYVWEALTGELAKEFKLPSTARRVSWSDDSKFIAVALKGENPAIILDVVSEEIICQVGSNISAVDFTRNNQYIVTTMSEFQSTEELVRYPFGITVWDMASCTPIVEFGTGVWFEGYSYMEIGNNDCSILALKLVRDGPFLEAWEAPEVMCPR